MIAVRRHHEPAFELSRNSVDLTKSDVTDLLDAIRAGGDIDVICVAVELVLQEMIEAETTEVIGAERYERTGERSNLA
jgi:hypothetical protein